MTSERDEMRVSLKETALAELDVFVEWYADTYTDQIMEDGVCPSATHAFLEWLTLEED